MCFIWSENTISVFPNPAQDHVTVTVPKGSANTVAMLYNVAGEMVFEVSFTNSVNEISTGNLPAGVYFLKVSHKDHSAVKRIDIVK